jgi:hypothetical protein
MRARRKRSSDFFIVDSILGDKNRNNFGKRKNPPPFWTDFFFLK